MPAGVAENPPERKFVEASKVRRREQGHNFEPSLRWLLPVEKPLHFPIHRFVLAAASPMRSSFPRQFLHPSSLPRVNITRGKGRSR